MSRTHAVDVHITNHGSIITFALLTPAATQWVEDHVGDDANWWCGALVVDQHYAVDLAAGMEADGLNVR